jgi:histidinol phosphatase-like enzyme
VRCIWLQTTTADAQINSIRRMIDVHGSLPTPEEIRERGKRDSRYLLPDAQFRYERTLEPPATEEGFESLTAMSEQREAIRGQHWALILDLDHLNGDATLREAVVRYRREGWLVFVHAWRPQVARGGMTNASVEQEFSTLVKALGGEVDWAYCPHDAGPPVCWCRKPIPGQLIEFAIRRSVALDQSIVIGTAAADRTMAERVGARFEAVLQ